MSKTVSSTIQNVDLSARPVAQTVNKKHLREVTLCLCHVMLPLFGRNQFINYNHLQSRQEETETAENNYENAAKTFEKR